MVLKFQSWCCIGVQRISVSPRIYAVGVPDEVPWECTTAEDITSNRMAELVQIQGTTKYAVSNPGLPAVPMVQAKVGLLDYKIYV